MGLVYSIPKSETTDGVARELGAWRRLCLKRKVSNTRAAEGVGPYNVRCVISELGINSYQCFT